MIAGECDESDEREREREETTSTHMRSNIDQMTEKVREWARARACVAKYSDQKIKRRCSRGRAQVRQAARLGLSAREWRTFWA